MNYKEWRKDNEDKYLHRISDVDPEEKEIPAHIMPCFADTAYSEECDVIVKELMFQMMQKENMNYVSFVMLFSEYLFETYNVNPIDLELLCQMTYKLITAAIGSTAKKITEQVVEYMTNGGNDSDEESSE